MKLTTQEYWEHHWQNAVPKKKESGCELHDDIAPYLPRGDGLSFIEVGCAPGRIIADLCSRYGYLAHGVDYACDPSIIEEEVKKRGAKIGKIWKEDFFTWQPEQRFDIVSSFGFIEHFDDAEDVVDRHFALAKSGGTVVIAMPNFANGQRVLHWIFDRQNLKGHNTRIMNLRFLEDAAGRNNAQLIAARYAGGHFDFWIDSARSLLLQRVLWRVVPRIRALCNALGPNANNGTNPWFSPYLFAVYRTNS